MTKKQRLKKCRYYISLAKALIKDGTKWGAQSALDTAYGYLPCAEITKEEIAVRAAYQRTSDQIKSMKEDDEIGL